MCILTTDHPEIVDTTLIVSHFRSLKVGSQIFFEAVDQILGVNQGLGVAPKCIFETFYHLFAVFMDFVKNRCENDKKTERDDFDQLTFGEESV